MEANDHRRASKFLNDVDNSDCCWKFWLVRISFGEHVGVVNWSLGEGIDMFEMRLFMLVDGGVDMLVNLLFNTAIGEGSDGIESEVDSFVFK